MYVALFKGADENTERYERRLKAIGCTLEVIPLTVVPEWHDHRLDPVWLGNFAEKYYASHAESTDVIQFLPSRWHGRPRNIGHHYGRPFSGYRVCAVKNRELWEDTAEHELLHAANDIVWTYLGVSLSSVFGVDDFDEDVVHGRHPAYREYDYDDVWEKVAPSLKTAIAKRRRQGYLRTLERLLVKIRELVALYQDRVVTITVPEEKRLLAAALDAIGTDASPNDLAPDELGCAETVSSIIRTVCPTFPVVTGTWTLWERLRNHPSFRAVSDPQPGDVVISPTGAGTGRIAGHAGIVGEKGRIMSNDSRTGTFEDNYDLEAWRLRYVNKGGFPVYYYRLM